MFSRGNAAPDGREKEMSSPLRNRSCSGGGGWIRTIEGEASRFTVCPLWPLGYSSVFSWAEEGGAGGRIRTPDLLITNQLLYQLSYTSKQRSAFTTMIIIAAGGEFVNSFFKKFFMWGAGPEGSGRETAGRSFDMAQELRCSLCRGELYPGDPYFELDGRTVCEDCLGRYARGYFAHRLRRVGRSKGERT